jgi:hypothetical protein
MCKISKRVFYVSAIVFDHFAGSGDAMYKVFFDTDNGYSDWSAPMPKQRLLDYFRLSRYEFDAFCPYPIEFLAECV